VPPSPPSQINPVIMTMKSAIDFVTEKKSITRTTLRIWKMRKKNIIYEMFFSITILPDNNLGLLRINMQLQQPAGLYSPCFLRYLYKARIIQSGMWQRSWHLLNVQQHPESKVNLNSSYILEGLNISFENQYLFSRIFVA